MSANHSRAADALARIEYAGWVSIEMRNVVPFGGDANVDAVARAVRLATSAYGTAVPWHPSASD